MYSLHLLRIKKKGVYNLKYVYTFLKKHLSQLFKKSSPYFTTNIILGQNVLIHLS